VTTPTQRLLDAVAAHQQHDEAVQHAAAVLAAGSPPDRHPELAQRLLDTWAALEGDDPDADVRALPVEPPVGTVVQFISGGRRLTRGDLGKWRTPLGYLVYSWGEVLAMAGPQGVRVLKDGA
jgi:hypothetical protein